MHLLHFDEAGELALAEFWEPNIPPYAVLSHTWGAESDELTYDDIIHETSRSKEVGYAKALFCGEQALKQGIDYFWVDTCCIDKTSTVAVAEAINSMFKWYKNAVVCYALLSDVTNTSDVKDALWFTRGWTLQELIAPKDVQFYSQDTQFLGDKISLSKSIKAATGIPTYTFQGKRALSSIKVAEVRSWMNNRHTKRPEDAAYCLLGIFDISMPPLYGEGKDRALQRLLRSIEEQSSKGQQRDIEAWTTAIDADRMVAMDDDMESVESSYNQTFGDSYNSTRSGTPRSLARRAWTPESSRPSFIADGVTSNSYNDDVIDEPTDYELRFPLRNSPELSVDSESYDERYSRIYTQILFRALPIVIFILALVVQLLPAPSLWPQSSKPAGTRIDAALPVFAILGKTGVGKSSFIKTLGGRHIDTQEAPDVCSSLASCTQNLTIYIADLPFAPAYLLDTPGFDDNIRGDSDIVNLIFNELKDLYNGDKLLKGLVYLYDIRADRIGGVTQKTLADIEAFLVGTNGLRNVMLVTTRWARHDQRDDLANQLAREDELRERYWRVALKKGSSIEQYRGTKQSAIAILSILNSRERLLIPQLSDDPGGAQDYYGGEKEATVGPKTPKAKKETASGSKKENTPTDAPHELKVLCENPWKQSFSILLQVVFIIIIELFLNLGVGFLVFNLFAIIHKPITPGAGFAAPLYACLASMSGLVLWLNGVGFAHLGGGVYSDTCTLGEIGLHTLPRWSLVWISPIICGFIMFVVYDDDNPMILKPGLNSNQEKVRTRQGDGSYSVPFQAAFFGLVALQIIQWWLIQSGGFDWVANLPLFGAD